MLNDTFVLIKMRIQLVLIIKINWILIKNGGMQNYFSDILAN